MRLRELSLTYSTTAVDIEDDLISTPADAAAAARRFIGDEPFETFGVFLLDSRHRVIAWAEVARGSLCAVSLAPRDIFARAVHANAAAIVAVHNHPSGDASHSPDDLAFTRRLKQAGEILGIPLLDHVILGDDRYFSFKEAGLL